MHSISITADRRQAKGTPATARPMPPSTVWTTAVTPTPSATARMACPGQDDGVLAALARQPPAEAAHASRRRFAAGVQDGGEDHDQEKVDQQCRPRCRRGRAPTSRHPRRRAPAGRRGRPDRPAPCCAQAAAIFAPTTGTPSHPFRRLRQARFRHVFARAVTWSACPAMVSIAAQRGRISRSSRPSVINATAGARRLPSRACRDFSSGQVETTSIVAQTAAARNGRRTHSVAAISSRRQMTASVVRVRSWRTLPVGKFSGTSLDCGSVEVMAGGELLPRDQGAARSARQSPPRAQRRGDASGWSLTSATPASGSTRRARRRSSAMTPRATG